MMTKMMRLLLETRVRNMTMRKKKRRRMRRNLMSNHRMEAIKAKLQMRLIMQGHLKTQEVVLAAWSHMRLKVGFR